MPQAPALASLGMSNRAPGFLATALGVLRFELAELRSQPGLYLFVPLILLQTLSNALTAVGAFDTPLLITPGMVAIHSVHPLVVMLCFLSLFYTTESLRRERNSGMWPLYYSTPARTAAVLAGKLLANAAVILTVFAATLLAGLIGVLAQRTVAFDLRPFLLVWGALIPTFILWISFVAALFAVTGNRYATYAGGLAALALTGWLQVTGRMSWVGNWDLWDALRWSDMGGLDFNARALLLNRLLALAGAAMFLTLAIRTFPRQDRDATRTVQRLQGRTASLATLRFAPFLVPVIALAVALWTQVDQGFQGKAEKKRQKDYWRQNLATWKDAPLPGLRHVEIDLTLDPSARSLATDGAFTFINHTDKPIRQIPLTGGTHWEDLSWTMNGADYQPEDRSRLYVVTPPSPLAPGDTLRLGFRFHGRYPKGITKNGGGASEFVLPSGVVLTTFRPSFLPILGFDEGIGVDEKNRYEPRVYPDDFHLGMTEPALGAGNPFTTRIRVTAPAEYTVNSVGALIHEEESDGWRTVVWESDHPVRFFNVVAGKWAVRDEGGTAVYYHPAHRYNIDEMALGLSAAREHYGAWFGEFPWLRLKLSEFPAQAFYAQGFPTNITFSEGIGFLTKNDPKTNTAFLVTAHEAAHQWWANILTPGKGPGGEILAEGMSHFSTILLMDQIKGASARIEFCKRVEERYGNERQVDSERPLVRIDGSKAGDNTVIYDKGGWVAWMLLNEVGRENALEGLRHFVEVYKDGPDYPVLQDFVASMRPFAPDSASFDAFVTDWFTRVVVPEYKIAEARALGGPDSTWTASCKLRNAGTGRMAVEVAAIRGERFDKDGSPDPQYRESRVTVTLGDGEEQDVSISCPFEPQKVLVDPDAKVLQLRRSAAVATL